MDPSGEPTMPGQRRPAASSRSRSRRGAVPLARRNLFNEKGRLAMSVAGVAFAVVLILIIASLYRGWSGATGLFSELPGDVWVAQAGTSDPLRTTSFLPDDRAPELARVPGVAAVIPVYARRIAVPARDRELNVYFMSLAVPEQTPLPADVRERFVPPPGGLIVDSVFAGDAGVERGDTIDVLGRELKIERVQPGGRPIFEIAFVNGDDAPALLGLDGLVSFYLLATRPGADLDEVSRAAEAVVPGAETRTSAEFADAMGEVVNQGFLPVVGALVAIGLVIGGAVVALTTYTATIEKARDFAVLKAVGASNGFVYRVVIEQSLLVGVLGSAVGLGVSVLAATLIKRGVPEFVTDLRWTDAAGVFAAILLVSLAAAYVPVRRINRIDPAMVFRA
jgi:putative ABC transport system permease protein